MYENILYCYRMNSMEVGCLELLGLVLSLEVFPCASPNLQQYAILHSLTLKITSVCACRKPGVPLSQFKIMDHLKEYCLVFIAAHQRIISVRVYHIYSAAD